MPEIRITAKTPYKEWLGGIDTLFIHACNGLMSDASALARVQVLLNPSFSPVLSYITYALLLYFKNDMHYWNKVVICPVYGNYSLQYRDSIIKMSIVSLRELLVRHYA